MLESWGKPPRWNLTLPVNSDLIRARLCLARPHSPCISSFSSPPSPALSQTVSPLSHIWTLQISVGDLCAQLTGETVCQQSQAPQPSHEPLQEGATSSLAVKRYLSRRDGVQARSTDRPESPFFPSQLQLQLYVFPLEQ